MEVKEDTSPPQQSTLIKRQQSLAKSANQTYEGAHKEKNPFLAMYVENLLTRKMPYKFT